MPDNAPLAVVLGCSGELLTASERDFFAVADPIGFILFRRNCASPDQLRDLVAALRDCVSRDDAPVLIDQEDGRVARLRPPHWRRYPSAARLASLPDPSAAEAARLGARLIADDLARIGITVNCSPVLDLPASGADPIIGDRAYGEDPERVARLAASAASVRAGFCVPFIGSPNYKQMHSRSRWRDDRKPHLTLAHRLLGLGTE